MSNNPAELIRSANPQDRMTGIKQVARLRNERALRVLAQLAKEDDDPKVRAFAKKGAAYVAKKLEEQGVLELDAPAKPAREPEPEPEPDIYEMEPVEVTPQMESRGKSHMDAAFDHHMNGDKLKAVQSLSKALNANPNLRFDEYFKGVATTITGLSGEEAVRSLASERKRKGLINEESQRKGEAALQDHMDNAAKHTWGTLGIDVGILAAIVFLGMFFTVLMIGYTTNARINGLENQLAEAAEQEEEISEEQQEQLAQAGVLIEALRQVSGLFGVPFAASLALAVLVGTMANVFIFGIVGHFIATAMGGKGTIPFTLYSVTSAYSVPMVAFYIVLMLGPVLVFLLEMPPRIALIGVSLILAIILFVISFRLNGRIRRAYYDLSFIKAYFVYFLAGIPAGIAVLFVAFIASIFVGTVLASIVETLPLDSLPGQGA